MKKLKRYFRFAFTLGCLIAAIHIIHMLTLDRVIQYREITFYSANWPAALCGYRIGFMADTHRLTQRDLDGIVAELNARNLDLLLLGGDYSLRGRYMRESFAAFAQIETIHGIFGVEGNHDRRFPLGDIMAEFGIGFLDNNGVHIYDGFYLGGVRDEFLLPCVTSAVSSANDDDFILLLMHNPDIAMEQSTAGIDLILAGHTHGGHVTFFGWAFYLHRRGHITNYGTRFAYGWAQSRDGVSVYVTRGIGRYSVPRVFARPQAVIFTMRRLEEV